MSPKAYSFIQGNLLASGANDSEIFIWDLNNLSVPMTPGSKSQVRRLLVLLLKRVQLIFPGRIKFWRQPGHRFQSSPLEGSKAPQTNMLPTSQIIEGWRWVGTGGRSGNRGRGGSGLWSLTVLEVSGRQKE